MRAPSRSKSVDRHAAGAVHHRRASVHMRVAQRMPKLVRVKRTLVRAAGRLERAIEHHRGGTHLAAIVPRPPRVSPERRRVGQPLVLGDDDRARAGH